MPPVPSDPVIAGILDNIYQSAISPAHWEGLPRWLAEASGGGAWSVQLVRPGQSRRAEIHGCNFDPALLACYPDHYAALNPWLPQVLRMPALQLVRDQQVLQREGFFRGAFYGEFLRPQGDIHRMFGIVVSRGEAGSLVVGCNHAPGQFATVGEVGARLLTRLGPHLQRGFDLTRTTERSALGSGARLVDGLGSPPACFALDARSRLVACDSRGEAMLARGEALSLGRERRLRFVDDAADATLGQRLSQLHEAEASTSFVVPGAGEGRILARLAPLPAEPLIAPLEVMLRPGRAVAALFVTEPGQPGPLDRDLTQLFDLTPAEVFVLRRLLEGLSMAEIAALREVSVNTVRNQMRSLFEKTGTRRQAELVALVGRLGA